MANQNPRGGSSSRGFPFDSAQLNRALDSTNLTEMITPLAPPRGQPLSSPQRSDPSRDDAQGRLRQARVSLLSDLKSEHPLVDRVASDGSLTPPSPESQRPSASAANSPLHRASHLSSGVRKEKRKRRSFQERAPAWTQNETMQMEAIDLGRANAKNAQKEGMKLSKGKEKMSALPFGEQMGRLKSALEVSHLSEDDIDVDIDDDEMPPLTRSSHRGSKS